VLVLLLVRHFASILVAEHVFVFLFTLRFWTFVEFSFVSEFFSNLPLGLRSLFDVFYFHKAFTLSRGVS
jgi:hypothetical protein